MKDNRNYYEDPRIEPALFPGRTISALEYTGLMPLLPTDGEELRAYSDLAPLSSSKREGKQSETLL